MHTYAYVRAFWCCSRPDACIVPGGTPPTQVCTYSLASVNTKAAGREKARKKLYARQVSRISPYAYYTHFRPRFPVG